MPRKRLGTLKASPFPAGRPDEVEVASRRQPEGEAAGKGDLHGRGRPTDSGMMDLREDRATPEGNQAVKDVIGLARTIVCVSGT